MKVVLKAFGVLSLVGGIIGAIAYYQVVTTDHPFEYYYDGQIQAMGWSEHHPWYALGIFLSGVVGWIVLAAMAKALDLLERIAAQTTPKAEVDS